MFRPRHGVPPSIEGSHGLLETAPAEEDRHDQEHDRGGADPTPLHDELDRALAEVVRREADAHGPADPARSVPEQEPPPLHLRDAGDPGAEDAQDGDETGEEDGLASVL